MSLIKLISFRSFSILSLLLAFSISSVPTSAEDKHDLPENDIAKMLVPLNDLEATVKISKIDSVELEKMGSELKVLYSIRKLVFQYKSPDKLRLEGHSTMRGRATMILNGSMRYYEVPKFMLKKTENLENKPEKRQSLLEFAGLISKGTLVFMRSQFIKEELLEGTNANVYELKYLKEQNCSYFKVWFDSLRKNVLKREWFDGNGKLRAIFRYNNAREITLGVWLPTQVEVTNNNGKLVGVLTLSEILVNQGAADELFQIESSK